MPFYLLFGLLALGFGAYEMFGNSSNGPTTGGYPDIDPSLQGGNYDTTYDPEFLSVAQARGVPFALLKAHAIQESSLNPQAIRNEPATSTRPVSASYGLMQILWWAGSNRWAQFGMSDAEISDGTPLYDPHTNIDLASQLILANLASSQGNLRDAINMYNAGVKESVREAPAGYVDKVVGYYQTIIGRSI